MNDTHVGRNEPCPCGSGKKFKHCCHARSFGNGIPQPRPVPTDGAFLRRGPEPPRKPAPQLKPITRVAVEYAIADAMGKADVTFCYELGTPIIMGDGNVLPVEYLKPGMQFRLEDGGVATTTKVEEPKVWQPPSQECDANGNSLRRVIGRVHYNGYFPRMDFGVPGDVIKTTPGHRFFSVNRGDWHPIETFQRGEYLRNEQGMSVPVEWISPMRWEFCDLYNVEVEEYHTYFVGGGPSGGIWSHNGLG
ncbi:MAG: SEC-C domain-containing protein, partial [Gemmataceae bacterium]|nr:SEC-C domain-containing protein [Gemmataceae bacterium]